MKEELEITNILMKDRHENIVEHLGFFVERSDEHLTTNILMPEIYGQNIPEYLKFCEGHVDFYFRAKIFHECAKGLEFLHNKSITHRDITSDNIMLELDVSDYVIKVLISMKIWHLDS